MSQTDFTSPATSDAFSAPSPTYRLNRRGKIVFTVLPLALVVGLFVVIGGGSDLDVGGL